MRDISISFRLFTVFDFATDAVFDPMVMPSFVTVIPHAAMICSRLVRVYCL